MIFTTKQTGDKGEAYAAKYLKKHKYKIIARNYKKPYGEIDIIAENKEVIAFVEVKKRILLHNPLMRLTVKSR